MMSASPKVTALAWSAPQIDGRAAVARSNVRTVGEYDAVEQRAWHEAEAAGKAAGLAAAQQEIAMRLRGIETLNAALQTALDSLARPLAQVDDQVHGQIAKLAVAIARGLIRRELRTDPTQVIGVVRETVALLPASARGVRVLLHPEDAALVRERLALPHSDDVWSIAEDPVLSRGDCRVISEFAQIDARIETRLAAVIAELLGDEREQPRVETGQ
jgi:flagellar assembly protein FliH